MPKSNKICNWFSKCMSLIEYVTDLFDLILFHSKCQLFQWNDWKSLDRSNNFVLKPLYFHTMDCKLIFISHLLDQALPSNQQLIDQTKILHFYNNLFHSYLCHDMEEIIFLYIVTLNSDLFLKQSHSIVCILKTWKSMSVDHFLIPLWCVLDPLIWRWVNDNLSFLVNYSFNPNRIYFPFGSNRRLATVNPSVQYLSNL